MRLLPEQMGSRRSSTYVVVLGPEIRRRTSLVYSIRRHGGCFRQIRGKALIGRTAMLAHTFGEHRDMTDWQS